LLDKRGISGIVEPMKSAAKPTPEVITAKRGRIDKRLANLRPIKPGEVRNPKGISGATKRRMEFRQIGLDVMGLPVTDKSGNVMTGAEAIWLAMRNKAIRGDVQAAVFCRDTLWGKPAQIISGDPDAPLVVSIPELIDRLKAGR